MIRVFLEISLEPDSEFEVLNTLGSQQTDSAIWLVKNGFLRGLGTSNVVYRPSLTTQLWHITQSGKIISNHDQQYRRGLPCATLCQLNFNQFQLSRSAVSSIHRQFLPV